MTLAGCVEGVTQGTASGPVTGSAGGATSVGADSNLQRCPETLGTLAIDDGRERAWWGDFTRNTQITSIEPMVRLIVQQSNCFQITSVGNSRLNDRMTAITRQQRSGEFRVGSRQGPGQRVAADYYLEPTILFAGETTSGDSLVGGLGGQGGIFGNLAVGVARAALRQSSTSVNMSLFSIRAGVQIAASEGSSTSSELSRTLAGLGINTGGAALSAYDRTPQGRATVAAFVDAYNKLVVAVRNYRAQEIRGGAGTGGRLRVN
ncbi:hypothetical protein HEQ75_10775 [Roseomonas sp. BU-1]|uniref:Peptidoglycan-binding protein n=2 Tax=Falsiroseomonas selenitidurans TaxID=2716335 RepID=A0ABX1E6B5_9PROT|nr:hypothetical protein [Falsiroseomonas selenitidurans]